jgi:hypothetical protein
MLNVVTLSVIMLNVVTLSVVKLNVITLSVIMLNVVMLNVAAPTGVMVVETAMRKSLCCDKKINFVLFFPLSLVACTIKLL